jgi:hypothetical protein
MKYFFSRLFEFEYFYLYDSPYFSNKDSAKEKIKSLNKKHCLRDTSSIGFLINRRYEVMCSDLEERNGCLVRFRMLDYPNLMKFVLIPLVLFALVLGYIQNPNSEIDYFGAFKFIGELLLAVLVVPFVVRFGLIAPHSPKVEKLMLKYLNSEEGWEGELEFFEQQQ